MATKIITPYGNVTQNTAVTDPWGQSIPVGYFDGGGDYLTAPYHADFVIGASSYTIEGWFRFSTLAQNQMLISVNANTGANWESPMRLWYYKDTQNIWIQSYGSLGWKNVQSGGIVANTWYHIAGVINGTTMSLYINGSSVGTPVTIGTLSDFSSVTGIGRIVGLTSYDFSGYACAIRISKGIARYTSNFATPTSRFMADSQSVLVLHMNGSGNTFLDSSMTGLPVWIMTVQT